MEFDIACEKPSMNKQPYKGDGSLLKPTAFRCCPGASDVPIELNKFLDIYKS